MSRIKSIKQESSIILTEFMPPDSASNLNLDNCKNTKHSIECLVAEDVRASQHLEMTLLKKMKINSSLAKSGEEALIKYGQYFKSLKLILLDISLSTDKFELNGLAVCKTIRNYETQNNINKCCIVALTGNSNASDNEIYRQHGFDDVWIKGSDLREKIKKTNLFTIYNF